MICGDPVSTTLNMKAYADQGGTATVSPETATVGQSVTYTATAAAGYQFDGWYNLMGEKVSDQATYTLEAESSLTLVARFREDSGTETANKVLLQKTYDYAVTLSTEGVTDSAKAAFETALAEAKAVLDNPNATDKPEASQAPETTDKPQSTDKPQATEQPENVPQTGDSAQLLVYVAALATAVLLMGTTVVVRRRRS